MRIETIKLAWFRGAADTTTLDLNSKSIAIYGGNGAGKSGFVDAVEYVLNDGKIGHLAHEYSGKRQEKAIINTHTPKEEKTQLQIKFKDGSEVKTEIEQNGNFSSSGAEVAEISNWDYRRTILRQDEVARFIRSTKGDKYSELLPLLGLSRMEVAAENLRQLGKIVTQESKIQETKIILKTVETKRKEVFDADSDDQVSEKIEALHTKYCADKVTTTDSLVRCREVEEMLGVRIAQLSADERSYHVLKGVAGLDLKEQVGAVRSSSDKLAGMAESFIAEKLEVLQSTRVFVDTQKDKDQIDCPACGRSISVEEFQAHLNAEKQRLQEIIDIFDTRKAAIVMLCDTIKSLKVSLNKPDVKAWRDDISKGVLDGSLTFLDALDVEALRVSCTEDDLKNMEHKLVPLVDAATIAAEDAPPDIQQLLDDKKTIETGKAVVEAKEQVATVTRTNTLISFLGSVEQGVREEIRLQSKKVVEEISSDVQSMWKILHPDEVIENVRLNLPEDVNKAIDIYLKFHGVEQESPRLTLSEGYRNSLGLCIFLAMAKREADKDRPVFLDDVVVSLDRNHRGMIVELLEKKFSQRQVVILTHDREWYTELRQQLDNKSWGFKVLLPYETPDIGVRWSHKTTTFDDARVHLKDRPDSAGNDARKIMDIELALIAERLQIKLPYLRADKNDKRMAHDFLERFVADGKKCFQKKTDNGYELHSEAIEAFSKADRLILTWGNRASHDFEIVRPEATKLIEACEDALVFFKCSSCAKGVWFADAESSEWVQCQCGQIRWRYGKI